MNRVDFLDPPRTSPTRLASLAAVALLHVAVIYLFVTGAARQVVRAIARPLETKVIVETTPLVPRPVAPPARLQTARLSRVELPYVPMPEIHVQPPPQPPSAISAVTNVKPETSAAPSVPTRVLPEALTPAPTPAPKPSSEIATARPPAVRVPPVIDAARNCKKPPYPSASIRLRETGTVLLRFLIDAEGKVKASEVRASSGHPRLDEAAREALSLCRFKPGLLDGKPVEAWASLRYTWVLQE